MKIFKKIQLKSFVLWIALFALTLSLFTGVNFLTASAETEENETEITYIDTEVESIAFTQHPTCVFLGFRLEGSDYDDYHNWEGDYGGTPYYKAYEEYVALTLTYWKNFSDMNSEGVIFDQLYAYWDAGLNPTSHTHALAYSLFFNSVAHRTTLTLLEYGFVIAIPAGTTFPHAGYVKGGCQGAPIMYRTMTDIAFYYDGNSFVTFDYAVWEERLAASEGIDAIDLNNYYEEEREAVSVLVKNVNAALKQSFSSFAIQDALNSFYAGLDAVMTIADYEELANKKTEAKMELSTFFEGFVQANYDEAEWNALLAIQAEANVLIDGRKTFAEVNAVVTGVQLAAGKVLTKEAKADLAAYKTSAIQSVQNAFVQSLYREQEVAQGTALVQEATTLIEAATTFDTIDGLKLTYMQSIAALKTDAQWTEEESLQQNNPNNSGTEEEDTNKGGNVIEVIDEGKKGCNSSVNGFGTIFGVAMVAALMVINKKRMEQKDEK